MVCRLPSLDFRLSGESADDSGVVPHEESRAWDIDEAGELVMDAEEACQPLAMCALPLGLLMLPGLARPFRDAVWLLGYDT